MYEERGFGGEVHCVNGRKYGVKNVVGVDKVLVLRTMALSECPPFGQRQILKPHRPVLRAGSFAA